MTQFRLAAIDIDDTLLGKDGKISEANAAAIAELRRRGVVVMLASGRSAANMMRFHEALGLGRGPVISSHGAMVSEAESGEVWFEEPAPAEGVTAATHEGMRRGASIVHYRRDAVYIQDRSVWVERNQARAPKPHVFVLDLLEVGAEGVFKVMWLHDPPVISSLARPMQTQFAGLLTVTETDPGYLEFTSPRVNKAVALEHVAERLGIARQEVLAFGDGNNDVPMLEWAGVGVAMNHARQSAKDAADLVAPEGDGETALARAIEMVLGERGARRAEALAP